MYDWHFWLQFGSQIMRIEARMNGSLRLDLEPALSEKTFIYRHLTVAMCSYVSSCKILFSGLGSFRSTIELRPRAAKDSEAMTAAARAALTPESASTTSSPGPGSSRSCLPRRAHPALRRAARNPNAPPPDRARAQTAPRGCALPAPRARRD